MARPLPLAILLAVALGAALAAPAQAVERIDLFDTQLLSQASDGGFPNGPSGNAVISQDGRSAKTIAFESVASNIVPPDTNGVGDVFVVDRVAGFGQGAPWRDGRTRVASKGRGGPANGRSYGPAIGGDASSSGGSGNTEASCVAFISEASNLVAGDTNGVADAFVYDLGTSQVTRVSVDSAGRQADGPSFDVAVDGNCEKVAFTSRARNLAQTASSKPNYDSVKTGRPPMGVTQVYVHVRGAELAPDRDLVGLTFLASASSSGKPGNRDSFDPSWAVRDDLALAFASRASNLDGRRDRNATPDVYVDAIFRVIRPYGQGRSRRRLATLQRRIRAVSVTSGDRAGNGASAEPSISDTACSVAFSTQATNLVAGDSSPTIDIVRADIRGFLLSAGALQRDPPGCRRIEGAAAGGDRVRMTGVARGNGPSSQPEVVGGGGYIVFASASTTFGAVGADTQDRNGVADAFLWSSQRNTIGLQSALAASAGGNRQLALPSTNPSASQRVNYVLFETNDPFADLALVRQRAPERLRSPAVTYAAARANPAFHQVYLRYLGAKYPNG